MIGLGRCPAAGKASSTNRTKHRSSSLLRPSASVQDSNSYKKKPVCIRPGSRLAESELTARLGGHTAARRLGPAKSTREPTTPPPIVPTPLGGRQQMPSFAGRAGTGRLPGPSAVGVAAHARAAQGRRRRGACPSPGLSGRSRGPPPRAQTAPQAEPRSVVRPAPRGPAAIRPRGAAELNGREYSPPPPEATGRLRRRSAVGIRSLVGRGV